MADVGMRELRQRLSEYLNRAERGEVLRVTDRGRPNAVLGPVPGRARVEDGICIGWITPGTGVLLGEIHRSNSSRRVLDVLAEIAANEHLFDSSALLKRYVEEADSGAADALLRADSELLTLCCGRTASC